MHYFYKAAVGLAARLIRSVMDEKVEVHKVEFKNIDNFLWKIVADFVQ